MEMIKNPIQRKDNIVLQKLENETLIYDLKSNKAFCLNETSALVWRLCNGNRSVSEIADEMSKQLKTLVSEDFVFLALDQLNKDGLLENGDEKNNYFAGLSRREVIRKVGFASVIALPLVSSLIAPEAAVAQSCLSGTSSGCGSPCCPGLTCFLGSHCCVPGVALANSPTFTGCQPIGTCGGVAFANNCCSGGGSPFAGGAACPGGDERCQCNPMP